MRTLRQVIESARDSRVGVGHFNISDSNQFNAIVAAAREAKLPVIIGVSEGERKFVGVRAATALVKAARDAGQEVYLNADHTYSLDLVKEAIDAGFDSVIFDGSHLAIEENIAQTKQAVAYARSSGRDVLVEGEIGRIGTSSKLLDAPPEDLDKNLTTVEEATRFVRETGVDLLAPAVGTMHGRLKSGGEPKIDTKRVSEIRAACGAPLVLHGGSGSSDADIADAARSGCAIVHINTDIRIAYRKGIEAGLAKNPDEIAPYRFLALGVEGVRNTSEKYLKLFAGE